MKICSICKIEKPFSEMTKDKKRKDGVRPYCKACNAQRMREYFKNNPDKYEYNKAIDRKKRPHWKRHNLSELQYQKLFSLYSGKCHACKTENGTVIDHDHLCCSGALSCGNCIRGLLCHNCNTALGLLRDSVDNIRALAVYLSNNGGYHNSSEPLS